MLYRRFVFQGDPWQVFSVFADEPHAFMLESSLHDPQLGRYTFIGCRPFQYFSSSRRTALEDLKQEFVRCRTGGGNRRRALPFISGIVGYVGYDYGRKQDNILSGRPGPRVPDVGFGFYDAVIVLDHRTGFLYLTSSGLPEKNPRAREKRAQKRLEEMQARLRAASGAWSSPPAGTPGEARPPAMRAEMTRAQYIQKVCRALDYIRRGDIYQVNVAHRFFMEGDKRFSKRDAVHFYRTLRGLSPSCFSAYFDAGPFQIVSSSPERFLRLEGRRVMTRPMKGTRPRGSSRREDRCFERDLRRSSKEQAELLMITDLLRNDLGRVCAYGTVRVDALRTIEAYATVYQATSTVSGLLMPGLDGFDALAACSPGGSITGCPKIRAMEIIDELEPCRRLVYTGALGYMDFSGDMDFSVLIRTLLVRPRVVSFHVGAGIVADSRPEAEYEETLVKAQAMQRCLQAGYGGEQAKDPAGPQVMVIDGEFVEADESRRRALTPGISRAAGVFETLRVSRGRILFFPEHFRRMKKSLQAFGIECPVDGSDFLSCAARLAAFKNIRDGRLRLMVWREGRRARWCAAAEPYHPPFFRTGFHATVTSCRVPSSGPQTGHKKVRYAPYYAESRKAAEKGYDEALFLNRRGHMTEGSRTNIFWVKGRVLWTPGLKTGCLPGIVRAQVLALARREGIRVRMAACGLDALREADEAFLTNSLMGLIPLLKIDGRDIGRGRPGALTTGLWRAYRRMTEPDENIPLRKRRKVQPAGPC